MARTALVTGGSRGIGAAISRALKAEGYSVAATYAGNDEAAARFTEESGIKTYKWNVADYEESKAGIARVEQWLAAEADPALAGLLPLLARQPRPPAILVELTPFSLALAGSTGRALVEALATLALPFWIVDHVAGRLAATDAEALATWCDNVAATAGDRGFMNILVGHAPAL